MNKMSESQPFILPPEKADVGRKGEVRKIDFRKIEMDKDFVWKLTFLVHGRLKDVRMSYACAFVLDPTEMNENLEKLKKNPQRPLGGETETFGQMRAWHDQYARESSDFGITDFAAALIKVENKPLNFQLVQLRVSNQSAMNISELGTLLEKAAIVLRPVSDEERDRNWTDFQDIEC